MNSEILKKPLPYLALVFAYIIWGANHVVAKITLQEFPPMTLGFLRFGIACLLIVPFLSTIEPAKKKIRIDHLPKLIGAAMLLITLNIAFYYEGLQRTTAINSSVIGMSAPIISVVAGWLFLKEKIYLINLLGIFLSAMGGLIILGLPLLFIASPNSSFTGNISQISILGNILIFLSCICSVAGIIFAKGVLKYYHPMVTSATLMLFGAIGFLIPAILEYIQNPNWIYQVTLLGVLGLIYVIVMSSICAYFLLIWALSKVSVVQASLFQYFEPAIAATLAVPLLGERVSFSFIVATVLIVLGVYWGTLGKAEHHHLLHRHHRN